MALGLDCVSSARWRGFLVGYILIYITSFPGGAVVKGSRDESGAGARRAKLFWNGRSQAVRLPKEFRFEGTEVGIRKEGDRVILEPIRAKRGWPSGYWERLAELTRDFEFPAVEPLPPGPPRPDIEVP